MGQSEDALGSCEELAEKHVEIATQTAVLQIELDSKNLELQKVLGDIKSITDDQQGLAQEKIKLQESTTALDGQLTQMKENENSSIAIENAAAAQIEELQAQHQMQKQRFTDDLRQAKKEMSNHSKNKLAAVKTKADAATKEKEKAEEDLEHSLAGTSELQSAMEQEAGMVHERLEKHNTAFSELTDKITAAEKTMQELDIQRCNTMSELSDMMQDLNVKRQTNKEYQEDNDNLRNELLRMRKVVSNVMAEKKQMADTLLEKDATSEQIQMLRDETKRLQDNSEKAHQDALEAHKAKDELSATLEALEQNFIRKIQVTSKSNNLSAYFPSPRSKRKNLLQQKQHGDLTKNLLDSLDSNPLDLKTGQKKGRSPRSKQ